MIDSENGILALSLVEILVRAIFAALVYPGLLFLTGFGLLAESLRRRFAANAEGRDPPPLWQPLVDFRKQLGRSVSVPAGNEPEPDDLGANHLAANRREGNRLALYALPTVGLLALSLGAVLLPLPGNLWPFLDNQPARPLGADLLAVGLLFLVPALLAVLVGSLGGSVYGQVAGSRIAQLLIVCSVPYAVAVFGPALVQGTLDLQTVVASTSLPMLGIKGLSGLLFLLCLPVLLRLRPLSASSGEVLEGVTTDLSGPPLALLWLMGWAERLALPMLFASLFVPLAHSQWLVFGPLVAAVMGLMAIIDTLLSQVRLRDALNFYLRYANPAALVLLIIAAFAVKV